MTASNSGSSKEDFLTEGVILGLARALALEGFPGVQGDFPNQAYGQQRRGCLN